MRDFLRWLVFGGPREGPKEPMDTQTLQKELDETIRELRRISLEIHETNILLAERVQHAQESL